jgi:hypothetical protein
VRNWFQSLLFSKWVNLCTATLRERERREKLEKKAKKSGGQSEEASRLAAEAAAREAHEAGERTKLECVVKALRDKMKNSDSAGSEELRRMREAHESLKKREKEVTSECERLRKELAAALRAAGVGDGESGAAPPDHVNFGAYVQKRREGKHGEAKSMAKRAAQTNKRFGVNDNNGSNNIKNSNVGGSGGGRAKSPTPAPAPAPPPARKMAKGGGMTMKGGGAGAGREAGEAAGAAGLLAAGLKGAGSAGSLAGAGAGLAGLGAGALGAGRGGLGFGGGSGVGVGVDVVGGGPHSTTTVRHGRRRGGV